MTVWFWKCYHRLNITYNLYSPNAQPLNRRFTGWRVADDDQGISSRRVGGWYLSDGWDKHKVLNVKVHIKRTEDTNLITGDCLLFHLKRSFVAPVHWKGLDLCSAPASEMTFICICLKAGCESHRLMPDYHKNSNLLDLQEVKLQSKKLGRKLRCEIVGKNHIILLAEERVHGPSARTCTWHVKLRL